MRLRSGTGFVAIKDTARDRGVRKKNSLLGVMESVTVKGLADPECPPPPPYQLFKSSVCVRARNKSDE